VPVLTAKGYAVLRPNYRGSTGYGSAFFRDVVGSYFRNMHLDVLAGVDFLIKEGIADPDRLAVMGLSAGGHLTNKLITVTTRFKAASAAAGVANWTSFLAETDTRTNRMVWSAGCPGEGMRRSTPSGTTRRSRMPRNVRTPTLLIAGENDVRVPLSAGRGNVSRAGGQRRHDTAVCRAARRASVDELRHQLFKANAELEWFDRYVLAGRMCGRARREIRRSVEVARLPLNCVDLGLNLTAT